MISQVRTHQALYRRWRAQTFGEIVGQEPVVQTLQNAVRSNKVAHALLFVGPRGTGKTSMARIVAKALNCTGLVDGEPDDTCEACVSIRESRALDVIEMDAASNNKVDDIREFLPRVATVPSSLRRKVFIVDEVQRIKEGWDLLLKTLEEPPDHVAFIFCTTDASQVRAAVLSRIQRFDFRPLTVPQIEGKLRRVLEAEGRTADDDAIGLVARLAAGGMRDAESMLDQLLTAGMERLTAEQVRELLGIVETETVHGFIDALVAGDALVGMRILAELEDRGRDLRAFLNQVVDALREALVARLSDGASGGRPPNALTAAARRLASIDPNRAGPGGLRFQLELALLAPSPNSAFAAGMAPSAPALSRGTPATATAALRETPDVPAAVASAAQPRAAVMAPSGTHRGGSPAALPSGPSTAQRAGASLSARSPAPGSATAQPAVPVASGASPRAPSSGPSAPASVGNGAPESSLDALYRVWPDIVSWIARQNPATKPLITVCRPIAVDGNVVTLGFPESQAFLKDVAERRRALLEEGVGLHLGRTVAVRCVAANLEAIGRDVPSQSLIDKAREIFEGEILNVPEVT